MKTLLAIMSYSKANETVARHWPWYLKAECDILGVGHDDTQCVWPEHPRLIGSVNLTNDSYVNGDAHPRRLLGVLRYFLDHVPFQYTDLAIIEYDCLFFRPLPTQPGDFVATLAGHKSPGFIADNYWHTPWWLDRRMAANVVAAGERLLHAGLIEHGFIDRWLGLLTQLEAIKVTPAHWYSRNTILPEHYNEAREAIRNQCWGCHGVKDEATLRAITEGL